MRPEGGGGRGAPGVVLFLALEEVEVFFSRLALSILLYCLLLLYSLTLNITLGSDIMLGPDAMLGPCVMLGSDITLEALHNAGVLHVMLGSDIIRLGPFIMLGSYA